MADFDACPHPHLDELSADEVREKHQADPRWIAEQVYPVIDYFADLAKMTPAGSDLKPGDIVDAAWDRLQTAIVGYQGKRPFRSFIRMHVRYAVKDVHRRIQQQFAKEQPPADDIVDGRQTLDNIIDPAQTLAKACDTRWFLVHAPQLRAVVLLLSEKPTPRRNIAIFFAMYIDDIKLDDLSKRLGIDKVRLSHMAENGQRRIQHALTKLYPGFSHPAIIDAVFHDAPPAKGQSST